MWWGLGKIHGRGNKPLPIIQTVTRVMRMVNLTNRFFISKLTEKRAPPPPCKALLRCDTMHITCRKVLAFSLFVWSLKALIVHRGNVWSIEKCSKYMYAGTCWQNHVYVVKLSRWCCRETWAMSLFSPMIYLNKCIWLKSRIASLKIKKWNTWEVLS